MALLTVQEPAEAGTTPTYNAVSASDTIAPGTSTAPILLHVKNGGGSPDSVSVDDPNSTSPAGATAWNPDITVSVPAGAERYIPIRPVYRYVNSATGLITITHSFTTTVTMAIIRVT